MPASSPSSTISIPRAANEFRPEIARAARPLPPARSATGPAAKSQSKVSAAFASLHSTLGRGPDELVHLELKTDVELVLENPFHDLARIDPAEDRGEQDCAAAFRQIKLAHFVTRPFVIIARAHNEFHFIPLGELIDVRPKLLFHLAPTATLSTTVPMYP